MKLKIQWISINFRLKIPRYHVPITRYCESYGCANIKSYSNYGCIGQSRVSMLMTRYLIINCIIKWEHHQVHNDSQTSTYKVASYVGKKGLHRGSYMVPSRCDGMTTTSWRSLTWKLQLGPSRSFIFFLPQHTEYNSIKEKSTRRQKIDECRTQYCHRYS